MARPDHEIHIFYYFGRHFLPLFTISHQSLSLRLVGWLGGRRTRVERTTVVVLVFLLSAFTLLIGPVGGWAVVSVSYFIFPIMILFREA